jgi:hypothetical protein
MFRFTIRDLLWLTVVVALGAGWWVDHVRATRRDQQWRHCFLDACHRLVNVAAEEVIIVTPDGEVFHMVSEPSTPAENRPND